MKKILITGGLGFIGSHLLHELDTKYAREGGAEIDIVDSCINNSLSPTEAKDRFKSVSEVYAVPVHEFSFAGKTGDHKYDHIYHFASPVGPKAVLYYKGRMASIILNDTLRVAEYAAEVGAKTVFVSTSEVYGKDPGNASQCEDHECVVPSRITDRLEYGVGKLLTEISLHNFARANPSLKYNVVRPFNIVGEGQSSKAGFVLPIFAQAALRGLDIPVHGDGKQRRTFTHADDICDAFIRLQDSSVSGRVYNVGNPANVMSIKDLAKLVVEHTGSSSKIVHVDPKQAVDPAYEEAWNKIPCIHRITEDIGWTPTLGLTDIVDRVIVDERRMLESGTTRPNQAIK